jgi:hypothetical protein
MPRYQGHNGYARVGTTEVGQRTEFDITTSAPELDGSVMGSGWTGVDAGQLSASGSIGVFFDHADAGQDLLVVGAKVALDLFPTGNTTGHTKISGTFLITEKGVTTTVGDNVKATFKVRNDGAVTETAVA